MSRRSVMCPEPLCLLLQALAEMKVRVKDLKRPRYHDDDACLLRFLRARKCDVDKSARLFEECLVRALSHARRWSNLGHRNGVSNTSPSPSRWNRFLARPTPARPSRSARTSSGALHGSSSRAATSRRTVTTRSACALWCSTSSRLSPSAPYPSRWHPPPNPNT